MRIFLIVLLLVALGVSSCTKYYEHHSYGQLSSADSDAAEPAIACAADGTVFVAWVEHASEGKANVMLTRLNPTAAGPSEDVAPVRVNPKSITATAWHGDPPVVTVSPDQTILVSWTAKVKLESGQGTDLFVSTSRDRGRTFDEPVKVNDDNKPASHGMHSMAVARDGRIYVAWLDERNVSQMPAMDAKMKQQSIGHHVESNSEVFFSSSIDNGRTFTPNKLVAKEVCPCCKTSLATTADGRVFLSWRQVLPGNFRHIAVASSIDQGQTFSEPKIVSDDQWMIAGCPVSGSAMNVTDEGTLHVLWYSAGKNDKTGLYMSESKDGGNTFGPRTLISESEVRGTPVLIKNRKQLLAFWESAQGIETMELDRGANKASTVAEGGVPAAVGTPTGFVMVNASKDQPRSIRFQQTSTK